MADLTGGGLIGGTVGKKVSRLVADTSVYARQKMADHNRKLGALLLDDFFSLVSSEIRGTAGPLFAPIADHPDSPDWAKSTFNFLARGNGQWQTFLAGNALGAGMGAGIGTLLTNELEPVIGSLVAANPHGRLSPETAARCVTMGIGGFASPSLDALRQGIPENRFNALVALNYQLMSPADIQEALNHGVIDTGRAVDFMRRAGFHPDHIDYIMALRHTFIQPATLAAMVVRGVVSQSDGAIHASRSGLRPDDFGLMVRATGNPPGAQELLFAYRKGQIDKGRLEHGLRQSDLRDEWIDVIEGLRFQPMSTEAAVSGVVQSVLSPAQGQQIAEQNGLQPDHFPRLVEIAGNPPGPETAMEWLRRGIIDEPTARQAMRESNLKNKYIDAMLRTKVRLPPQDSVRAMFRKGVLDRNVALDTLLKLGFEPTIAAALLNAESATKTDKERDLTKSEVRQLYADRAITRADATEMLVALGYDQAEADFILDLSELARLRKFAEAAINKVRGAYVAYRLDDNTVGTLLDSLQVPSDQRDELLALWGIERSTISRGLTEAQVVRVARKGLITPGDAYNKLLFLGYGSDDATLLLMDAGIIEPQPVSG
jgi:hypothetical protein